MCISLAPPECVDVLIAEDDGPLRASLRYLLEREGYTCAEAENGREALAVARQCRPRCVLLDLTMPGLDGFAVARNLRRDPRTRGARIHCLTGRTDPAARERARRAGCEGFLAKPAAPAEVLEMLRRPRPDPRECWVAGLTKTEAEDLLDWLHMNGFADAELLYQGENGYAVRCGPAAKS